MTRKWSINRRFVAAALLLALLAAPTGLWAAITTFDDVVPPFSGLGPWVIAQDELRIGITSDGRVEVDAGSVVNSSAAEVYLGWGPATTGTVLITGGSQWTTLNTMSIGAHGVGALRVEDKGELTTVAGWIGGYDPFGPGEPLAS